MKDILEQINGMLSYVGRSKNFLENELEVYYRESDRPANNSHQRGFNSASIHCREAELDRLKNLEVKLEQLQHYTETING